MGDKKNLKENLEEFYTLLNSIIGDMDKELKELEENIATGKEEGFFCLFKRKEEPASGSYDTCKEQDEIIRLDKDSLQIITSHINSEIVLVFTSKSTLSVMGNLQEVIDAAGSNEPVVVMGYKKGPVSFRKWEVFSGGSGEADEFIASLDDSMPMHVAYIKDNIFPSLYADVEKEKAELMRTGMKRIKMEGHLIITDPCYIVRKRDESDRPKWSDFMSYTDIRLYPDYNEITKDSEQFRREYSTLDKAEIRWQSEHPDDWDDFDGAMKKSEISAYITHRTLCGDGSYDVIENHSGMKLGSFCVDSGEMGIFRFSDVMTYNPEYDYAAAEKRGTACIINDFKGEVFIKVGTEAEIHGEGNISFHTKSNI